MQRITIFFVAILLGVFFQNCSPRIEPLSPQDSRIVERIEEENHKIHSFLVQTDAGMPDVQGILSSVLALESSSSPYASGIAKTLKERIQAIKRTDKESDYQNYSEFSVALFPLVRAAGLPDVYKFYCPMTKKFWIARTKPIQNPFSPEMRTCGDLIIE